MEIDLAFKSDKFHKMFWDWFDSLSKHERDKFNYYPSDMAKLNFYNTVFRKIPIEIY